METGKQTWVEKQTGDFISGRGVGERERGRGRGLKRRVCVCVCCVVAFSQNPPTFAFYSRYLVRA